MKPAARVASAIQVLDAMEAGLPAEQALTNWARSNRYAGSGDRAAVRDHVFDALRCRRSAASRGGGRDGRSLMLGLLRAQGSDPAEVFTGERFAPTPLTPGELAAGQEPVTVAERLDVQDWTLPLFQQALGDDTEAVLELMRTRAPVMLRVNLRRGTVQDAQGVLARDGIATERHPLSPTALCCAGHPRGLPGKTAFREGLVELQDAASQAVVDLLLPHAHGRVLDYCAGGGGKALAIAARSGARIVAHDIDPARMRDLPQRADRAGAKVTILQDRAQVAAQAPYDFVLCDVPCSGSGAWRRAPEAKWHLTPERLAELGTLQVEILDRCAELTARRGVLAYATCSMFAAENRQQITSFLRRHGDWHLLTDRLFTPLEGGDGFYTAHLTRRNG